MKKIKEILSKIIIGMIVIFLVFIFIKGTIVEPWTSPEMPTTYSVDGEDQRSLNIILLQDNKAIMWHKDVNAGVEEAILTEMRGTHGTHYFWRFWKIETYGKTLPGYRMYPSGTTPVAMEIKAIRKYTEGNGNSAFQEVNQTTYTTILFRNDAIQFEGMWLQKEETNPDFLAELLKKFEEKQ